MGEESNNYGEPCVLHDKVGVLLEFEKTEAKLTFYRNKVSMGVAFANIPLDQYYPVATMYYNGVKVTLNPNADMPPPS